MIYITGDTHGDFSHFAPGAFPAAGSMTKDDYVIIAGDFGGVWNRSDRQKRALDELEALPFTTLFLDGNHENYDLLAEYPVSDWHGGRVQRIRESVIHLMRGEIYELDGRSFFVMGGASCHDICYGVLREGDKNYDKLLELVKQRRVFMRVEHVSWWEEELPSEEELGRGWENLVAHQKKVDYVLTHCAPTNLQTAIQKHLEDYSHPKNTLTDFLQRVYTTCSFAHWYCGHYHIEARIGTKFDVLYESIIPINTSASPAETGSGI